jgi:hypothetical protein
MLVHPRFCTCQGAQEIASRAARSGGTLWWGVNAFSCYETGKTTPPLALVQLFKLLDRHLDLLDEVKAA